VQALGILVRALAVGLIMAAPIGPVGILVVHRASVGGSRAGWTAGLGASVADLCYATLAAVGLPAGALLFAGADRVLAAAGGLILLFLGVRILRRPFPKQAAPRAASLATGWLAAFLVVIGNPGTVLLFIGAFHAMWLDDAGTTWPGLVALLTGIFVGTLSGWMVISAVVQHLSRGASARLLLRLAKLAGAVVLILGVIALGAALRPSG